MTTTRTCPDCGSHGPFRVEATIMATIDGDDIDTTDPGDIDISADAFTTCPACDWTGILDQTRTRTYYDSEGNAHAV